MDLFLNGKVVLITGSTRGIGRATALRFAEEGCSVALCGRNREALTDAVSAVRQLGGPAFGAVADVTKTEDVQSFVEESAQCLGRIDIVVCSAGDAPFRPIDAATDQDWHDVWDLNVVHSARAVRTSLPYLKEHGGSIVLLGSVSGWRPFTGGAAYAAAKAGLIHLASCLALELAPVNIRVNTVSPGSTMWPGGGYDEYRRDDPEGFAEFQRRQFPKGRLATAEEIADIIVFVASPRAAWINGTHISADGLQGWWRGGASPAE